MSVSRSSCFGDILDLNLALEGTLSELCVCMCVCVYACVYVWRGERGPMRGGEGRGEEHNGEKEKMRRGRGEEGDEKEWGGKDRGQRTVRVGG